ncbi:MAG TPA: DUF2239 family protein [Caulobacteraceae bacterium]
MGADPDEPLVIAFEGQRRLALGPLHEVEPAVRAAMARLGEPVLAFDARTSRPVEIAPTGAPPPPAQPAARPRGRPRLGVAAREVTLLPRHWEWLAAQPGGASAALRRLVEGASRAHQHLDRRRAAQESAYRFLSAMAGDLRGFEEASRALFRGDAERFAAETQAWPPDIRDHAQSLASTAFETGEA